MDQVYSLERRENILSAMDCVQEQPADMDVDGDESNINDGRVTEETIYPSPEELVAKSRAPVKKEYICAAPPAPRGLEESKISVVKKSKRQRRKDRLEEVSKGICNAVVKAGDVNACPFKDCRFSHDLEAFISQKEPDLPGDCPFLLKPEPCPYGQACRFARSHASKVLKKTNTDKEDSSFEMNVLSKDTQKLMRKNTVEFPKSDEQLKDLGLWIKVKQSPKLVNEKQLSSSPNGDTNNVTVKLENDLDTNGITVAEPIIKKPRIHSDSVANSVLGAVDLTQEKNGRENSMDNSTDYKETKLHLREKKLIDFREKLYLAPLTTVGNLPFRRLCKVLGADITCGEMAMCSNLLQGQSSEWALLRRHSSEDLFGVQICGAHPDTVAHTVEIIEQECKVDFIDINVGCPIDIVVNKGAGSCLLTKPTRMYNMIKAASRTMENPLTVKVRMGYFEGKNCIHSMIPEIGKSGAVAITIHGRTRQQRYSKLADWSYIEKCVKEAPDALQVVGNGDIFAYTDWNDHLRNGSNLSTCMIARGALIKPWLFTEIKEQRHWDITSGERLELLRDYVRFGLQHWGSDKKGVETTRYFLLEWLSYMYRYVPVGLLDILPQRMNWRPPSYFGRNDLETLMASDSAADWVRISEMLLGPVPEGFCFTPKHKSNAYDRAENG